MSCLLKAQGPLSPLGDGVRGEGQEHRLRWGHVLGTGAEKWPARVMEMKDIHSERQEELRGVPHRVSGEMKVVPQLGQGRMWRGRPLHITTFLFPRNIPKTIPLSPAWAFSILGRECDPAVSL